MGSQIDKLHIFFFPFMMPGHSIPMTDMAKLFAMRGVKSTVVVTSLDAESVSRSIEKTQKLGFDIQTATIQFPLKEVGLPEDFETKHLKSAKSPVVRQKFMAAVRLLDQPLERLIDELHPDCVVADVFLPWTTSVAAKLGVPRLVFHGTAFFPLGISQSMAYDRPYDTVSDDSEPFLVPNFPGDIALTRAKIPDFLREETDFTKFYKEAKESELASYGVVVNSFYELESVYADYYSKVLGIKSWGIGPLLIGIQSIEEKLERKEGDEGSTNRHPCLKWLDSKEPDSVIYICFGSTTNFSADQLHQIAVGIEASGQQFVWVVKAHENGDQGEEEWLPQGYESRISNTGLIIRGWAPQVSILEHKATASFITHCGWNSTLEGISAGVSMVTWPVAAEQFYNEKLLTEVLRIGVEVGAKKWVRWIGDEVRSEMVEKAVKRVMVGEEAAEMRRKARELSEMARKAVEEGGSSYLALSSLMEELGLPRLQPCELPRCSLPRLVPLVARTATGTSRWCRWSRGRPPRRVFLRTFHPFVRLWRCSPRLLQFVFPSVCGCPPTTLGSQPAERMSPWCACSYRSVSI